MSGYQIVYADPPWRYSDTGCNGNAESHYKTMKLKDICKIPIKTITDTDCILFIWTTYPMLREVQIVIKKWGFQYKTIGFQWIKTNQKATNKYFFGLGRWTRGNTEACLIATKGKPVRINSAISQIISSPIERHSKKPDLVRDKIIELVGPLPRIELFARNNVPGWDSWGNEIESKFDSGGFEMARKIAAKCALCDCTEYKYRLTKNYFNLNCICITCSKCGWLVAYVAAEEPYLSRIKQKPGLPVNSKKICCDKCPEFYLCAQSGCCKQCIKYQNCKGEN